MTFDKKTYGGLTDANIGTQFSINNLIRQEPFLIGVIAIQA